MSNFAIIASQSMSFPFRRHRGLSHLQAFDLCPFILQLGLQLADLCLLTAHERLFHHGLFLELQLALQRVELEEGTHTHVHTNICMSTHVHALRSGAPLR